jgi:hypothetical protein
MITCKINASRIDKNHMFKGEKGTYVDLVLFENKGGPDQYGNDGFVTQGISKEARDRGEKGPISGNWKRFGSSAPKPAPPKPFVPTQRQDGTRY